MPAEIAGSEDSWTLALTPEAQTKRQDADLAIIGSPIVDRLISFATDHGRTAAGRFEIGHVRRKNLREIVEQDLVFSHCRVRYDETPVRIADYYYALFDYRITYLSDEKRERLVTIPVALDTALVNSELGKRLDQLSVTASPLPNQISSEQIRKAHDVAKASVRLQAMHDAELYRSRIRKRFEVDYLRITDYFDQTLSDITTRLKRESDAEKRKVLESKAAGASTQKAAKIADLTEKSRVRPRADLMSVQIIAQEKSAMTVQIDRKQITRPLVLVYDSLLHRLEPPVCEGCNQEMSRIWVSDKGVRLCPACSGQN